MGILKLLCAILICNVDIGATDLETVAVFQPPGNLTSLSLTILNRDFIKNQHGNFVPTTIRPNVDTTMYDSPEGTKPTNLLVDPTMPTEPTNLPADPTEPNTLPANPTHLPADPTEPIHLPVDPTEPTTLPVDPTDPTHLPADPTEPNHLPVDPTEPIHLPADPKESTQLPEETTPTVLYELGELLRFNCIPPALAASTSSDINWTVNGMQLNASDGRFVVSAGGTVLSVRNATEEYQGNYSCSRGAVVVRRWQVHARPRATLPAHVEWLYYKYLVVTCVGVAVFLISVLIIYVVCRVVVKKSRDDDTEAIPQKLPLPESIPLMKVTVAHES